MIVGIIYCELHIPAAGSLKEKRSVIKSIKQRIRNKFNVSVAEVGFLDKWQRAALGIVSVSSDKNHIDAIHDNIEKFIASDFRVVLTRWEVRYT